MPCSISPEETLYYERAHNEKVCGKLWTNHELTTAVACELARRLEAGETLATAPAYVKGWIAAHKLQDQKRGT